MTEFRASSSSSSPFTYGWSYHVFLSFRGENTRYGFTGNLYCALRQRGIRTFIDDEGIRKGEEITPTLLKKIEESKTAIVVFSKDYASSTFCLTELTHILDRMKGHNGRFIWPVFYDVDPSDIRHQKGSYKAAFDQYEGVKDEMLVKRWRLALNEAANLSGWHFDLRSKSYEYKIIEEIVEVISKDVSIGPLHVAQFPVGLDSRVKEVCSLLNKQPHCDGAIMVGIFGIGGIGKTTIARAVYNEIASNFEHICFLNNVKEHSICDLQKRLLSETIREKHIELEYYKSGIPVIKDRLHDKRILLILDDVDTLEQLRALAGESSWFGSGSIIIVTTRDRNLLTKHEIKRTYEATELNDGEACELLILNAFRKEESDPKYKEVINRAVKYARGLPLALEIFGSNVGTGQTVREWETALDICEKIPDKIVQKILKVSYDGLEETYREIFLDIACFLRLHPLEYATNILSTRHGIDPEPCIRVLIDKSLIKIEKDAGYLDMHDLIQDMGLEIVRQESPLDVGKRSRLWSSEDILHVLKENTGTRKIQVIITNMQLYKDVEWSGEAFEKMKNLKVLGFDGCLSFSQGPKYLPNSLRVLEWMKYPSLSLPDDFRPINLVKLNLREGHLKMFGEPCKYFYNLRQLDLSYSENLEEVFDISGAANLEELYVRHCYKLIKVDDSIGHLAKLKVLDAEGCFKLDKFIVGGIKLPSLEILNLKKCSNLCTFPEILVKMEKIKTLDLTLTSITKLPESIKDLVALKNLCLSQGNKLRQVATHSTLKLKAEWDCMALELVQLGRVSPVNMEYGHVTRLRPNHNILDELLVMILGWFPQLEVLQLSHNDFTVLPTCIKECRNLKELDLNGCKKLREIRGMPPNIEVFSARNCKYLISRSTWPLLRQALHETGNAKFILPGQGIPKWFHKRSTEGSLSFWIRKKFPEIALCAVLSSKHKGRFNFSWLELSMLINGTEKVFGKEDILLIQTYHIYLFNLRQQGRDFTIRREILGEEWNHVEVSWKVMGMGPCYQTVTCTGVYIYNYDSCTEDILFENPSPQNRTPMEGLHKICDSNLKSSNVYCESSRDFNDSNKEDDKSNKEIIGPSTDVVSASIKKKEIKLEVEDVDRPSISALLGPPGDIDTIKLWLSKYTLVEIVRHLTLDLQQRQHLTCINQEILESSENVQEGERKDIIVYGDNTNEKKVGNTLQKDQSTIDDKVHDEMGCYKTRVTCFDLFRCLVSLCSSSATP